MGSERTSRRRGVARTVVALAVAASGLLVGCGDDGGGGGVTAETTRTTQSTPPPPETTTTTWVVVEGRPWRRGRRRRSHVARARWSRWAWRRRRDQHAVDLPRRDRRAIARAWARDGELEHASIPAFVDLAAHLRAHGAPGVLVAACEAAADDERDHTARCFSLASRCAGRTVRPGRLPATGRGPVPSLAQLAVESLRDGALNEGVAARLAAARRAVASDPEVVATLAVVARDEAVHAEIAWSILAWCLDAGGAPVREAVAASASALPAVRVPSGAAGAAQAVADAHGVGVPEALAGSLDELRTRVVARVGALLGPAAERAAVVRAPVARELVDARRR